MNNDEKIKCVHCNTDVVIPEGFNRDQVMPVCSNCFQKNVAPFDDAPPLPFYKRWYYTIKSVLAEIRHDYIIIKVYSKDLEAAAGDILSKEITDRDFYNVRDRRFYGVKEHATPMNYFVARILLKRFRKRNIDTNIDYWAEPVFYYRMAA